MRKSAYAGITFAFFVVSVLLQWLSGWAELSAGTAPPDKAANIAQFTAGLARETFAHWQGGFLQVLWQMLGIGWFLHLGSAATRRQDERVERKLDVLLGYLALEREREDIDRDGEREASERPEPRIR